jgi:DNA invertase Pin-like site-specific DNA recombinase
LPRHADPEVSETRVRNPSLTFEVSDVFSTVWCMGHLLGYARVSTTEQNPALQTDALTQAGCARVWTDVASGSRDDRLELGKVLDQLLPGDTLVVWRLDRLGRSLRHLIDTVTELDRAGVGFRSLQESIDTTTPGGRLSFHVFGALAEFERDLIRDRTLAGLDAARLRGRRGGRPTAMTPAKLRQAERMYSDKRPVSEIAAVLGVGRATVYRHIAKREPGAKAGEAIG